VIFRLARPWLRCKLQRRAMLPKDLWKAKGIIAAGTDTAIYRDRILHYWGKQPYEYYAYTEAGVLAGASWTKKAMTFMPYSSFLEFIPEQEWLKSRDDPKYQPSTVLLNELEAGGIYEIVSTNFYGMPFLRYRAGDLIKITALEDKETGIKIPQVDFHSRADGIVDVLNIARLDERTVWQAIANTGIDCEDWSFRKEYEQGDPVLHLYIEPKEKVEAEQLKRLFHEQLIAADPFYEESTRDMGAYPLKVSLLTKGTFQQYFEERRKEGADLAHLKPPHMNASNAVIQEIIRLSKET